MGSDEAFPRDSLRTDGIAQLSSHLRAMHAHHVAVALQSLGRNLTIAAGLCEAFRLGERRQIEWVRRWQRPAFGLEAWGPGCGRSAP